MGDRRSWGMSFLGYVTKAAVSAILIKGTEALRDHTSSGQQQGFELVIML